MIKSITFTNHLNESLSIEMGSPDSSGFLIRFVDGLGPPKANIEMTDMSLMDGSYYNSARIQSRNIVISLLFVPSITINTLPSPIGTVGNKNLATEIIETSIEDVRQRSYQYFPLKKRIKINIETDNRSCEVYGYVESNDADIFNKECGATISILCPSSYLFSKEINTTNFQTVDPMFEFPFGNESLVDKLLEFAVISGDVTQVINYTGDAETGIVMSIHATGDAENIEIYKLEPEPAESIKIDTDRLLALTGQGIHLGDDIIISTVKGNKYATLVRNGVEVNILNCLEKYPDWFQLSKGDNIFTYVAESGINNLQFKIENQIAYEGI